MGDRGGAEPLPSSGGGIACGGGGMKTINLLPTWYLNQQRARKNLRLQVVGMILLGAVMLGAMFVGQKRLASMKLQSEKLAAQLNQIGDPSVELLKEQMNLKHLEELKLAHRELGKPIPYSKVIQQVQNGMTPGMALSNVGIDVR